MFSRDELFIFGHVDICIRIWPRGYLYNCGRDMRKNIRDVSHQTEPVFRTEISFTVYYVISHMVHWTEGTKIVESSKKYAREGNSTML